MRKTISDNQNTKTREQKLVQILRRYCNYHLDYWDPEQFDWKNYSPDIAYYASKYFDIWWNPDKFNWHKSYILCRCCAKYFKKWWDPEKFNWFDSADLAIYCNEYFEIWAPYLYKVDSDHPWLNLILKLTPEKLEELKVRILLSK